MNQLLILGAGGFAKEIIALVESIQDPKWALVGLVDDNEKLLGTKILGYPVFSKSDVSKKSKYAVCSVSNPRDRERVVAQGLEAGLEFVSLVHPKAVVSNHSIIGKGAVILAGSVISPEVNVGDYVIINKLCSIGHDTIIGNYSTIAPGVVIGGNVIIDRYCNVGMNASIIQSKRLKEGCIVGAGAVVIDDVPINSTVAGVPAQPLKKKVK